MKNIKTPLVSICIPVFNGENFIHYAIESAIHQSYKNIEILIADNASYDQTYEIIQSFDDRRIKYIKNSNNIGSIANFNLCLTKASGKYFILLPHDDVLPPDAIQTYLSCIIQSQKLFAFSNFEVIDESSNILYKKKLKIATSALSHQDFLLTSLKFFNPVQSVFVDRAALLIQGGFDESFGIFCDIHAWLLLSSQSDGCVFIEKSLYKHRSHLHQGQVIIDDPLKSSFHFPNQIVSYNQFFLKFIHFLIPDSSHSSFRNLIFFKLILPSLVRDLNYKLKSFFHFRKFIFLYHESLLISIFTPIFKHSIFWGIVGILFFISFLAFRFFKFFFRKLFNHESF